MPRSQSTFVVRTAVARPAVATAAVVLAILVAFPVLAAEGEADPTVMPRHACDREPYVQNVYWTTPDGPAAADVHTAPENFLKCTRGQYALCYYSGADGMPCKVDEVTGTAHCECQVFTASKEQPQMITIGAIQNTCVYIETVAKCGIDGSGCREPDSAPVCHYLAQGTFHPATDLVSTFSLQKVKDFQLGCADCEGVYAGCMTAPCYGEKAVDGKTYTDCECPLARGPYQYGRRGDQWTCDAGEGLTWSAAYDPAGCPEKPGIGSMPAPSSDP